MQKTNTARRIEILCITIMWLGISFFYLLFALNVWPPLDTDALAYMPPIVQYAQNHKLTNAVWSLAKIYDPTREGRLVYHGFLYQMLVGSLMPNPTYRTAVFMIAILNVITLGSIGFIFYRLVSHSHLNSLWRISIAGSALLGISNLINGLVGRPDTFVILIISLAIVILMSTDKHRHWIIFGLAIGILICSHTISAIISTALFIAYLSSRFDKREFLSYLFRALGLASLTFAMCFLWYPYSLSDWIRGNYLQSLDVVWPYFKASLLYYWFITPSTFFYGVTFIIGLGCAAYLYQRVKSSIKIKRVLFFSAFVALALSYYFGIRVPLRSYNLRIFAPLVYTAIIYTYVIWDRNYEPGVRKYKKGFVMVGLLTIFIISSFSFCREILLFRGNLKNGTSYNEARKFLQDFRSRNNGVIMLSGGFFSLTEDYNNIVFGTESDISTLKPDYILLKQAAYRGKLFVREIPGFIIIKDFYCKTPPRLFGIDIARINRGYDFAVYRRVNKL